MREKNSKGSEKDLVFDLGGEVNIIRAYGNNYLCLLRFTIKMVIIFLKLGSLSCSGGFA